MLVTSIRHEMKPIILLSLILIATITGCTTLRTSEPPVPQISLRLATHMMARQARVTKQDASKVIAHLNILEATLPLIVPAHFDEARTRLMANTSGDEQMLLLIVIDLAEKYANRCLKNLGNQERQPYPKECRAIVGAVIIGAREGLVLAGGGGF
jgi:hypothetical protein